MATKSRSKGPRRTPKQRAKSTSNVNQSVNKTAAARPVGQVKEKCPYASAPPKKAPNTSILCDIASLTLTDKASTKTLTCAAHADSSPPPPVPDRIARLLDSYDLVMELVSDYQAGQEKKNFVELTIQRTGKGNCPNHEHPSVKMTPANSDDSAYDIDWKIRNPPELKIPARPIPVADKMVSWIIPFWTFGQSRMDLTVVADGCGVGVESPVNYEFKALVSIYPNDAYELTLKLPPFKKWEEEKKRMHWNDKTMTSGSRSSTMFGKKQSEGGFEREKEGDDPAKWSYTKGQSSGGKFQSTELSYDKGELSKQSSETEYGAGGLLSKTTDTETGESSYGTSLQLELKHNGEPYDVSKTLGNITNAVFLIMKDIRKIKELLDIVPQIGLTYKFEASVLEGSLTGKWGNRFMDGPGGDGPRHLAVESFFDVVVEIKLFEISIELGFGFQLTIPAVVDWFSSHDILEIVLKAAINTSLDAALNYTAHSSSKDNHKVAIESKPYLKVYIEFTVTVLGVGLRSEGGVRGGLECEASFQVSFSHAPDFEAKAASKPIELYGQFFIDGILWDTSKHWEYSLVPEHVFHEGPLPPLTTVAGAAAHGV